MRDDIQHVYRVTYCAKYMDMSAGNAVDGPRWTGGYVDGKPNTVLVVAPSPEFAEAYVIAIAGELDGATEIQETEDLGKCMGIVELIGYSGKRPTIIRPFEVRATKKKD